MNKRAQFVWRSLIACGAGLLMSVICLYVGLPTAATLLQERQSVTQQRFESVESDLKNYRACHHAYPNALSQLPNYSDTFANDGWHQPIIYKVEGNNFLLTSYGADHKPGGVGLNCDLTNSAPSPAQALPSAQEIWASPLSGGLKGGAVYSGLLTAFLTFQSFNPAPVTRRSKSIVALKIILTLVAALLVSLLITFADIPLVGH